MTGDRVCVGVRNHVSSAAQRDAAPHRYRAIGSVGLPREGLGPVLSSDVVVAPRMTKIGQFTRERVASIRSWRARFKARSIVEGPLRRYCRSSTGIWCIGSDPAVCTHRRSNGGQVASRGSVVGPMSTSPVTRSGAWRARCAAT